MYVYNCRYVHERGVVYMSTIREDPFLCGEYYVECGDLLVMLTIRRCTVCMYTLTMIVAKECDRISFETVLMVGLCGDCSGRTSQIVWKSARSRPRLRWTLYPYRTRCMYTSTHPHIHPYCTARVILHRTQFEEIGFLVGLCQLFFCCGPSYM